jgi:FdhE protein
MGYVAVGPGTRESRLAAAASRWKRLVTERPEFGPAVELQRQLIGLVADLAESVEGGRLPRLSLPAKYLAAKLSRGVPALTGEPIPLPVAVLTPTLLSLCDVLARGGAGAAAEHIAAEVSAARADAGALLTASFTREQGAIRAFAERAGLAPDLLWLVAELATSPFAHALQRMVFAGERIDPALAAAATAWRLGYCPACGSWPALAELVGGRRLLRCSFCAAAWEASAERCVYCSASIDPAMPSGETTRSCLDVCGACKGYLKIVASAAPLPFPLVALADLETTHLDLAAAERGYVRPALRELAPRG